MSTATIADAGVYDSGSIVVITPFSPEARAWIDENVYAEPYQWMAGGLCVESGYAWAIIEGMTNDGFEVQS